MLDGASLERLHATNRLALGALSTLGAVVLDGAALGALGAVTVKDVACVAIDLVRGCVFMKPESRAIGQALLDHHHQMTQANPPPKARNQIIPQRYTITYAVLCERAGVPHLTQAAGGFLEEIAQWCSNNDLPPLNSLAVRKDLGMPGEGYDKAGGFLIIHWDKDVRDCISCERYPTKMPA